MKKTWRPTVAGGLLIALNLPYIVAVIWVPAWGSSLGMQIVFAAPLIILLLLGATCALLRKLWWVALTVSIGSLAVNIFWAKLSYSTFWSIMWDWAIRKTFGASIQRAPIDLLGLVLTLAAVILIARSGKEFTWRTL